MISVVQPTGALSLLSQLEAESLSRYSLGDLYELYRNCSLAVLNSGTKTDNSKKLLDQFKDFEINVIQNERGVKLELINPPKTAFVDGELISSIQNNLYAVLRDIVHMSSLAKKQEELLQKGNEDDICKLRTNEIYSTLRLAGAFTPGADPNVVVCWGGHAINEVEYAYAYRVGFQLGLRKMNICTGCGPGVMEAPMKGASFAHTMQKHHTGRFFGFTEPSIIAAEPPNPMVSDLVIFQNIEQRLEAFVRYGNVLVVFPGGPGTAEELLYILTIKLTRENRHEPLPLILTGPKESEDYFKALDTFIKKVFGESIARLYNIIIDDPEKVATTAKEALKMIKDHRTVNSDAYYFNWTMRIPESIQQPFEVNHENMANLNLHHDQPQADLAANLRKAFSGIVSGNVKEHGMREVATHGPFILRGDPDIADALDELLQDFIRQKRYQLSQEEYVPCFKVEK